MERRCGQYSVTNCRCDVGLSVRCFHLRSSKIGVRRSMFEDRWSKIDAKIDDRWSKIEDRWSKRRSMIDDRWSMIDGRWSKVDGREDR